jgi:uncharacterized cupredoxin-like copper-binding protein
VAARRVSLTDRKPVKEAEVRHRDRSLRLSVLAALATAACVSAPPRYLPQTRELTLLTVPLLSKELESTYPFLREDFAPGGVLEGKEVYAFVPSSLTVVEGDSIAFTFVNPEDDAHDFVLPGLSVAIPGQSVTHASYLARRPGLFTFVCSVPGHLPAMYGQLVVLPASVAGGFAGPDAHDDAH